MPKSQIPRYGVLRDISATLIDLADRWLTEDEDAHSAAGDGKRAKQRGSGANALSAAEQVYRSRRGREKIFPVGFFGEPAWDMLLDLYISAEKGLKISVTSACIAGMVPITTGLRWLAIIEQEGLATRNNESGDGRMTIVEITPKGQKLVESYLEKLHD